MVTIMEGLQIREATEEDFNELMEVERVAFGHDKEARLTAELLRDASAEPRLSLLAFDHGEAVGHILFTRATIEGAEDVSIMLLAPLAVKPAYQKMGIGGALIRAGLSMLKDRGVQLVFVLGHKEYYPRHGFLQNAQGMGFMTPQPDPMPDEYADYWMVQALTENGLGTVRGKLKCADSLNRPEHWRE